MTLQITGSHLELTDAIRAHAEEKFGGLEKYSDAITQIRVDIGKTTNHHHKGDVFRAEVNVDVPGKVLRAETTSDDLYKAINEAKDIIKQELVNYKERLRGE